MSITTRRLMPAFLMGACVSAALMVPAAASAEVSKHCVVGANIHGEGSSLQGVAEEKWDPAFNKSEAPTACNGKQGEEGKPVVTYTPIASAVGMEKWGFGSNGKTRSDTTTQFVGTDEPPNQEQINEILDGQTTHLETIPVVQESIAVIVHLPKGCTVTSNDKKSGPGRFVLTNKQMEEVFAGEITKWTQITGVPLSKAGANTWTGESCENTIKRTVRGDGSGTTASFKKVLNSIKEFPAEFGGKSWKKSGEAIENTEWPDEEADPVVRGKGGPGEPQTASGGKLSEWLQGHEGEIGYAGIGDARGKHVAGTLEERSKDGKFGEQEGAQIFWVQEQDGGTAESPKFAEPSVVGLGGAGSWQSGTKTTANCVGEKYTNGTSSTKFPPATTQLPWNEATSALKESKYDVCALSYILAYDSYHLYEGFEEGKTDSVVNFLKFALGSGAEEGQTLMESASDYLGLPISKNLKTNVLEIARKGAERVEF